MSLRLTYELIGVAPAVLNLQAVFPVEKEVNTYMYAVSMHLHVNNFVLTRIRCQ